MLRNLLLAGLLAATGCTTTTTVVSATPENQMAAQLTPGVSTIADARSLLGAPFQTVTTSSGVTLLTYARTQVTQHGFLGLSGDGKTETIVLVFNANGVLTKTATSGARTETRIR